MGNLLRSVREKSGLSVRQLAAAAEVSASSVHRIEQGTMQPTVEMMHRLTEVAGADLQFTAESDYRLAVVALSRVISEDLKTGDDSWIVRKAAEFAHRFNVVDVQVAQRMIAAAPQTTGDTHWDAFLAALVEWLAVTRGIAVPSWVYSDERYLHEGWWVTQMESMKAWEYAGSPASFQSHGVYIHRDSLVNV